MKKINMFKKLLFVLSTCTIIVLGLGKNNVYADSNIDSIMNTVSWNDLVDNGKLRETEMVIVDDCVNKNSYDTIDFRVLFQDANYQFPSTCNTIVIKINIDMKQIDKGYQHFYIHNSLNNDISVCKLLDMNSFSFKTKTIYCAIPKTKVTSDLMKLFIRYDASGDNSDDWSNKNLSIGIGYSNTNLKISDNKIYFYEKNNNSYKELTYSK